MGESARHYKALMKKNCINWKRTPCGSICEIICPVLLMLILVYARSQVDPVTNDDFSLYSLRRPFYPIAKPELGNKFVVSLADQQRQLDDYRPFFEYMDAVNVNMTVPINITQTVEVLATVSGQPNPVEIIENIKNDIRVLTNLTRLIEQTPLYNFTDKIAWDALEELVIKLGLENIVDVAAIKEFALEIEEAIENPEATIKDLFDIDLTKIVEDIIERIPDTNSLDSIDIDIVGYLPLLDFFGPYAFFPSHCYPGERDGRLRFNSPVIAYVKTGASVESDIIDQLTSLFRFQKTLAAGLQTVNLLGISASLFSANDAATSFIREEEFQRIGEDLNKQYGLNSTKVADAATSQYLPDNNFVSQATRSVGNFTFKEFASKDALDKYIADERIGTDPNFESVCFGFSIQENEVKNKYELELFFNDMWPSWLTSIPNQKLPEWNSYAYTPDIEGYFQYSQNGFAFMQNWVANTVLKRSTGQPKASIVAMAVPARLPSYTEDDFARLLTGVLSFFFLIMYVPPMYRTSYRIVAEKESKVKESMRMMGLRDTAYWLSWLSYYTIVNTAISFLTWLVLFESVTSKTSGWILFLVVWLFGQSLFGLLLITQSLFTRARAAAITTSLIYFGTSIFQQLINAPESTFTARMLCCLSPTVAMLQTVSVMTTFEASQVGSNSTNLFSEFNNFTVGHGLIMMAFDFVWITAFGLYLEQVMPKTFGSSKSVCFFFKRDYWSCCRKKSKIRSVSHVTTQSLPQQDEGSDAENIIEKNFAFETALINPDCYERLSTDIMDQERAGQFLKVEGLKKQYENGFKAVNGLNVKMFSDQIFVLLGHNGAGKSTTISMLTGLINSSEGQANLFGIDMFTQMGQARQTMGVCPQHDVLFDLLTPEEHLDIFYEFKGADTSNKKKEIQQMLLDIGVADKKDNLAYQLSGGNKRKLSVAIALCGNSRFVLLDEPTAGLDIQARRQLWNMLRNYKKDKIVLLTTHYMDEADILGDRIGIMTAGKMTCLGSSMFLKSRFGVGYVMTVVKTTPTPNDTIMPYLTEKLGPDVSLLSEIGGEMTIQFPKEYTALFKDFFADFDNDLAGLGIQTYGISITTLEQVFLEIGHNPDPKPRILNESGIQRPGTATSGPQRGVIRQDLTEGNHLQDLVQRGPHEAKVSPLIPSDSSKQLPISNPVLGLVADANATPEPEVGDANATPALDLADARGPNSDRRLIQDESDAQMLQEKMDKAENLVSQGQGLREDSVAPFVADDGDVSIENENGIVFEGPRRTTKGNPQDNEKLGSTDSEDKNFEKFSLAESKLDTSFWNNFIAVLTKRKNSYLRSKKRIVTEILLPSGFMIIGVWIASIDYQFRSPSKLLKPSLYPLKQQLYMNQNAYNETSSSENVSPRTLAENLPDFEESFDVTFTETPPGKTFDDFADRMFEFGTTEAAKEPYLYGSYEIFQADRTNQDYKFVSYMNLTSPISSILFPQFMYESILKVANDDPSFEFKTRLTPYPLTYEVTKRVQTADAGSIIFFSAIAYSIVITVTVSYLVVERISQLKHVQVITGMRLSSYWISNFIFDAIKLYITVITTICLFYIFDMAYESSVLVYALFPFGILPFTYVFSFCFSADSAAQTFTMFCHTATILVFSTVIFIVRVVPTLETIGDNLHYGFHFIPTYSLASSLYFDASGEFVSQIRNTTDGTGPDINPDPWHWNNNTLDIIMMMVHFVFWFLVLFLIEADCGKRIRKCWSFVQSRTFPKPKENLNLDADVITEIQRVADTPNEQLKIKVKDLRKVYPISANCCSKQRNLVAVEKISFGLEAGECFALLGVNGAGKSTTFKSLTSEVEPTSGSVHIGALDIRKDFNSIKKLIGYCPQTNPIFDYMSVDENIEYFARIKGIPHERRQELVNRAIKQLDLQNHRDKLAGNLSGGNKRKLSVAIAIVGSPPIILLDEPSAGMDPEARRFMWRVVGQIANDKTSAVILTTHSMEEAEALSSKMGIMVKGGIFKCFGTPMHIKDKFGTGFVIEIKAQLPIQEEINEVREGILSIDTAEDPSLQEMMKKSVLTAEEASKILTEAQVPGIVIEQILHLDTNQEASDEQDAEELAKEVLKRPFTMQEIAHDIFVKGALFGVIESLCREFVNVEVIEHYGSYMRLRVERHGKTIGSLFKLIEELKEEHQLEDYSVSQTTLEQIFQGFADLKFNENVPTYCIDEESGELAKIVFE